MDVLSVLPFFLCSFIGCALLLNLSWTQSLHNSWLHACITSSELTCLCFTLWPKPSQLYKLKGCIARLRLHPGSSEQERMVKMHVSICSRDYVRSKQHNTCTRSCLKQAQPRVVDVGNCTTQNLHNPGIINFFLFFVVFRGFCLDSFGRGFCLQIDKKT